MKQKPIIFLLVLSLLLTLLPIPSMALTNTEQADALFAAGLFQGTGSGYNLPGILNRAQGITLALRAQGHEKAIQAQTAAQVAITMGRVYDADKVPDWARSYVAFALNQNPAITAGVSVRTDGRVVFAPEQTMSGRQFITFMARAMGYNANSLDAGLDMAVTSGMLSATQVVQFASVASFSRGQAVDVIYSALTGGKVQSGAKLVDTLVASGAIAPTAAVAFGYGTSAATPTPTLVPTQGALAVSAIDALNCKQIRVVFNNALLADSVTSSMFVVKDEGTTIKPVAPVVGTDGKTVLLTLSGSGALKNATRASVMVKKEVKDISGARLGKDFEKNDVMVMDTNLPDLQSVQVLGSRMLKLVYNEPVWNGSSDAVQTNHFTVKSGIYSFSIMSATAMPAENAIYLSLGGSLNAGTFEVTSNANGMSATGSVRDYAGYTSLTKSVVLTYAPDTTPVTALIEKVNRLTRTVTVKFNKPVYGEGVRLYQLVSGVDAYGSDAVTKTEANATANWEFVMKSPIPTGSVQFWITSPVGTTRQLSDLFGQKVPDLTLMHSVVADTVPPTVTAIHINSNNSLDVVFSEEVDPVEADKTANFEVRNASGQKVTIADAQLQADQQTVRLLVPLVDLQTYTIKVLSMKDVAGNVMTSPYTATKTISDNTNPKVVSAYASVTERKIYIQFSEAMNESDMSTKTYYLVDRNGGTNNYQPLETNDSVTVLNARTVVLTLSDAITTPSVKMFAFRDLSGKKLGSDSTFEYTGENGNLTNIGPQTVSLELAELVAPNQVKFTFNTRLSALGSQDFLFRNDATGADFAQPIQVTGVVASGENDTGGSIVVVLLNRNLNADATYTDNGNIRAVEVQVVPIGTYGAGGGLISARNQNAALTLQDAYGGGIARDAGGSRIITWNDFNMDGRLDTVVILYEEPVMLSSLSVVTFTVEGYSITGVSTDSDGVVAAGAQGDKAANARYVVLNISRINQPLDAGTKPTVMQLYPIMDSVGNIIE